MCTILPTFMQLQLKPRCCETRQESSPSLASTASSTSSTSSTPHTSSTPTSSPVRGKLTKKAIVVTKVIDYITYCEVHSCEVHWPTAVCFNFPQKQAHKVANIAEFISELQACLSEEAYESFKNLLHAYQKVIISSTFSQA